MTGGSTIARSTAVILAASAAFSLSPVALALVATDPLSHNQAWYLNKLNLPAAWDITTGSTAVKIAVLDTGVISTLADFEGRILPGFGVPGFP